MADNRNAGWRGRYGWGEKSGADGSFGEERWSEQRFDRENAVGYNPAGPLQGGYGAGYDRYRGEHQGWGGGPGPGRDRSGYGGADYQEGPYTPYGRESRHDHAYSRRQPDHRGRDLHGGPDRDGSWSRGFRDEARSFEGHNEYIEAVTDGSDTPGEHRGRGPKGYRRSDDRIREDINDRLTEDSWLDATHVEVAVEGGEVTLTGTVSSRQAKRRAEDIAERVSGVDDVQNNIKVNRQSEVNDQTGASTMAGPTS